MIDDMPNLQQKNLLYMALLTRWANADGSGAADYVSENFSDERKAGMLGAVFSSRAANEPLVAWKWFEANRNQFANPNHEHQLVRSLYQGALRSRRGVVVGGNVRAGQGSRRSSQAGSEFLVRDCTPGGISLVSQPGSR
jgi:hypothetical protein